MWFDTLFLVGFVVVSEGYIVNPGPSVVPTKGEVWPKPQVQEKSDRYFVLRPDVLQFNVSGNDCQTLENVTLRYTKLIQKLNDIVKDEMNISMHHQHKKRWLLDDENFVGYFDQLIVNLEGPCSDTEYPTFESVEEYSLNISDTSAVLHSTTLWGIMRGIETFSQMIYIGEDSISLRINATNTVDYPRFKHRGLLLDTSRHFIPKEQILQTLDAMSYNKLNVFHWHIVDDQSFPYVSVKFPELSEKGAYHPVKMVYTQADIKEIIEYARERAIRVIPEFDTPGHTRSWGVSHPEILTACYEEDSKTGSAKKTGDYGPIDPTQNATYSLLTDFFLEIGSVFPDDYVHLGGDEVGFECWQSNPDINEFMKKINITGDYAGLESYYMQKLINIVDTIQSSSIVWEEVFSNGVKLPNETIVHVWKTDYIDTMQEVTASGRRALLSGCWYLDHLSSGGDWEAFYVCDPADLIATDEQKALILGGEACMWAEVVDQFNVISRVWPRASATAERLWSNASVVNLTTASHRMEEHTCRLNRRGIHAQPANGAGFCVL